MAELPSIRPEGNVFRTADLLGAFSLASDLGTGLHTEHGARSCYIGMHIAQEMELPVEQRADLFYAELLKDAGCTAYTSQLAAFWVVDELAAKRDLYFFRNAQNPIDVFSWLRQYVAQGGSFPSRATHIVDFLVNPNPPKDTDGRREESGRGGEGATGEIAWVPFGVGRSADGLHRRTGAPMAVCGSCDAGDGERIRSRELSRTGLARVCGDLRLSGGWVADGAVRPGVEWLAAGPRRG